MASAADPVAGQKSFAVCKACHQVGETAKNVIGPKLNGIVGRAAGADADFKYSDAMKNSGLTWDEATLTEYLKNPKAKVPGTKMAFAGLKDDTRSPTSSPISTSAVPTENRSRSGNRAPAVWFVDHDRGARHGNEDGGAGGGGRQASAACAISLNCWIHQSSFRASACGSAPTRSWAGARHRRRGDGLVGAYLIYEAHRLGAPKTAIARMIGNLVMDTAIGAIPFVGDIWDFFFRSNDRNMQILAKHVGGLPVDLPYEDRQVARRACHRAGRRPSIATRPQPIKAMPTRSVA
jgi:cytochrome c